MNILKIKKNFMVVSRASVAIYLILKAEKITGKKILVPANICYAAIYPIIYSGNIPIFCDVDEFSGNVSIDLFSYYSNDIAAAIVPHMYGNPASDIAEITTLCNESHILLIEDCASAMGAETNGRICGSYGDYSIFSTGYSKTLDLGFGGIVLSNRNLDVMKTIYENLPEYCEQIDINESFFTKLYRLIRNNPLQDLSHSIWKGFMNDNNIKNIFLHKRSNIEDKICDRLGDLPQIIQIRRYAEAKYRQLIKPTQYIRLYSFSESAVPWRFCLFVDEQYHRDFIEYLLDNHVPVSDWYPVVVGLFNPEEKIYKGADSMEKKIINFPLLINEEQIQDICFHINNYFDRIDQK